MRIVMLCAVSLLSVAATSHAQEPSRVYLAGTVHYLTPDNDRSSSNGAGGSLLVGLPLTLFSSRGSLEFAAYGSEIGKDDEIPAYSVYGLEVDLRGILSEQARYSTFLLAGVGVSRNERYEKDSTGHVTGGFGVLAPMARTGWYLRSELRMHANRAEGAPDGEDLVFDYRAALGLEYSFADAAYARALPPPAPSSLPPVSAPASFSAAPLPQPPQDSDGDGVIDANDLCPGTAPGTAVDQNGCSLEPTDADRDNVPDDIDRCPDTPLGAAVDSTGCSVLLDADGDGISDGNDRCPTTTPGAAVDFQGCPLAPPDADRDGVPDTADRCPGTAAGAAVDARGCPVSNDSDGDGVPNAADRCAATPPRMRVDATGCVVQQSVSFSNITFEFSSSRLTPGAQAVLDGIAEGLRAQTDLSVEIGGHTDAIGSQSFNLKLSQERADAVRGYLVSKGVAADRLRAQGYGEFNPLVRDDSEAGRAQNRRVEFNIRR